MKEFLRYFFTEGQTQEFAIFTPAHFAPIIWMIAMIFLIRWKKDAIRNFKHEVAIRYILAFALIVSEMAYYWRYTAIPELGGNAINNLPIGVCAWSVIFCAFMVIGKSQRLFDIAYFWLLSGSLFALITPTPLTYTGPARFRYYQFWLEHLLGYVAVFYMIFVHGMRPYPKSMVRSYIALLILVGIAMATGLMGQLLNLLS